MTRTRWSRASRVLLAATVPATMAAAALAAVPTAMAGSSVPNLAGGPAVYDPASNHLEVYALTSAGTILQAWQDSSGGWHDVNLDSGGELLADL